MPNGICTPAHSTLLPFSFYLPCFALPLFEATMSRYPTGCPCNSLFTTFWVLDSSSAPDPRFDPFWTDFIPKQFAHISSGITPAPRHTGMKWSIRRNQKFGLAKERLFYLESRCQKIGSKSR